MALTKPLYIMVFCTENLWKTWNSVRDPGFVRACEDFNIQGSQAATVKKCSFFLFLIVEVASFFSRNHFVNFAETKVVCDVPNHVC